MNDETSTQETDSLHKVVVIAASAGGVDALVHLMPGFPATLPAAVLIVQHISENQPSILAEILDRNAHLRVLQAEDNMPIRAGVAYIAEPGKHLRVKDGRLRLDSGEKVRHVRPAANVLFTSVAAEYGDRVIGVVLTGSGSDGTEGCRNIKKMGGATIAQDKETSVFFQMPGSAIKAHCIDHVAPLSTIAEKIIELIG